VANPPKIGEEDVMPRAGSNPLELRENTGVERARWLVRQRQRLALLRRALRPSDGDAREILWASLRRRWRARTIAEDAAAQAGHEIDPRLYQEWIARFDELSQQDRSAVREHVAKADLPVPLVLFLFDGATAKFAASAVDRLRVQLLDRFDALLCFSSDCLPEAIAAARRAARDDSRFTISSAPHFHDATAFAGRDHLLLAAGGILLREHALYMFVTAALGQTPCLVYADEDHLNPQGLRCRPFFKPSFSPELQRRTGYIGPCVLLRGVDVDTRALSLGEGSPAVERRIEEAVEQLGRGAILNLPFVLYHDALAERPRRMPPAELSLDQVNVPTVSIIIPTRNRLDLLGPCLASIVERTRFPRDKIEIIIVDNGSTDPETLRYLGEAADAGAIRLLHDPGEFNYARLNNLGAQASKGELLVFLNNDTLVDEPRWLELLAAQAMQKDVAAVGAKLLYPDRTVQFGGTVLGIQGVAAHAHVGLAEHDGAYRGLANVTHEVGAVTGACLAIRREVFDELGGLDPALAVACNDVLLCVEALSHGYRNIYVARPLLIHLESKSRGFDDTQAKREVFLEEGCYLRSRHRDIFKNDPCYSPNLSTVSAYDIAVPPRREKPWRRERRRHGKPRILMLSHVHGIGHGVPLVLRLQAEHLARSGHEVFIGGPRVGEGIGYEGCRLSYLNDPAEAASYAVAKDIDCIVAHTAPFFSVVRYLGDWPRVVLYDYGEPDPSFFADSGARRRQQVERRFCLGIADHVFAISATVRAEIDREDVGIIRLGNSHLASWSPDKILRREEMRAARGWMDKVVVLNVCRFEQAERRYKGIDIYAEVVRRFREAHPESIERVVFVLCGKATSKDIKAVEVLGLTVVPNVTDQELADLYAAADIYMNFSQWEGYNLGIGQALAMGLPVIASDIPAHRDFGIPVTNDPGAAALLFGPLAEAALSGTLLLERKPRVWTWDEPLAEFAAVIENACR
jgi:GT2 family glycosyltransferase